jgi:hypothetical protein
VRQRRLRPLLGQHDWIPSAVVLDDASWIGAASSGDARYRRPTAVGAEDLPVQAAPPPPPPRTGALGGLTPRQRALRRLRCVTGQHDLGFQAVIDEARPVPTARYRPRRLRSKWTATLETTSGHAAAVSGTASCRAIASATAAAIRRVSGQAVSQATVLSFQTLHTTGLTQLVQPDPAGWASRILALIPAGWAGDAARTAGGVLWSLCQAAGTQLAVLEQALQYAKNTCRLLTAQDVSLDTWSQDLYGSGLPRLAGETDSVFRQALQAALFVSRATRGAMRAALAALTGTPPRLTEPWSPGDTGAWDVSYVEVDVAQSPSRIGDSTLRYQAAVDTAVPATTQASGAPAWGFGGGGAGWNAPTGSWWAPSQGWTRTVSSLYSIINGTKAEGTIVWVRTVSSRDLTRTQPAFRLGYSMLGVDPLG